MEKGFKLKAKLLEYGIKVTPKAKEILDKQSDIWLMDDYITCSGITLQYEDTYATIGVEKDSPYELIAYRRKLYITDGEEKIPTIVITPPDYMKDEIIVDGKKICVYVNTYTDRTRLQLMSGCSNNCKFCNAVEFKYELNSIKGMEEALEIALKQTNTRHLLISSGSVYIKDLVELTNMYDYFVKKYSPKMEIDIMMTPRGFDSYNDSSQYEGYIKHLKEIGVHGLSINMELNNVKYLKKYCPEKYAIGHDNYLKFLELAVKIFGKDRVRSLLIVGIEPLEDTLKGVENLAKIGVNPVLSPLFPYGECNFPPKADLFIEAKEKAEAICKKYKVKMGPLCKACTHNVL